MLIIITQILLPLLLLLWLAFFPATGKLAYGLQVLAIAGTLLGLAFAALWSMPPFWLPYGYLLVLLLLAGLHIFRGHIDAQALWSVGWLQAGAILVATLLGLAGICLFVLALAGRVVPDIETVDITYPFAEGHYLVAHGGANTLVNAHLHTLDPEQPRFRDWRGQSRALDLFRINAIGLHMNGWYPDDPSRYTSFGTAVLAPCSGRVALAVDSIPDNSVPFMNRQAMAGNHVAIECGANRYVVLAHFRNGSIAVQPGQQLAVGDYLGQLGNSGNSSEPHLHIHAQRGLPAQAPLSGEPLLLTLNGRFLVRNQRFQAD